MLLLDYPFVVGVRLYGWELRLYGDIQRSWGFNRFSVGNGRIIKLLIFLAQPGLACSSPTKIDKVDKLLEKSQLYLSRSIKSLGP
jgi:hypothetical protein